MSISRNFCTMPSTSSTLLPIAQPKDQSKHTLASIYLHKISELFKRLLSFFLRSIAAVFPGIVSRKRINVSEVLCFSKPHENTHFQKKLQKFQSYDITPIQPYIKNPISVTAKKRGFQLINRLINKREKAIADYSPTLSKIEEKLIKTSALLFKACDNSSTRYDFDIDDWETLDKINFQLIQEHFNTLIEDFNSDMFKETEQTLQQTLNLDYKTAYIAEILALSLAPGLSYEGKTLNIPTLNSDNKWILTPFKLTKMTLGDKLPAWLLENATVDPWIVIRGTETISGKSKDGRDFRVGSHESILADLIDPQGISSSIISQAMVDKKICKDKTLTELFLEWNESNLKVNLVGHSLGGCLVNDISVRFWHYINKAYAFSSPGVSKETEKKWTAKKQEEAEIKQIHIRKLPEKLFNLMYEGDFVPSAGRCLIGSCFAIKSLVKLHNDDPSFRHVHLHLNNRFEIVNIDTKEENRKLARKVSEGLRVVLGTAIRTYYTIFNKKKLPSWWNRRHHYQKQAKAIEDMQLKIYGGTF